MLNLSVKFGPENKFCFAPAPIRIVNEHNRHIRNIIASDIRKTRFLMKNKLIVGDELAFQKHANALYDTLSWLKAEKLCDKYQFDNEILSEKREKSIGRGIFITLIFIALSFYLQPPTIEHGVYASMNLVFGIGLFSVFAYGAKKSNDGLVTIFENLASVIHHRKTWHKDREIFVQSKRKQIFESYKKHQSFAQRAS